MNTYLNCKIDFAFIITSNILLKHNNYLNQNIKIDNYFMELSIYDHNEPLNFLKNYYYTIKKILKIAIMRRYNNILILYSNVLLKNDWIQVLNNVINNELQINKNNFGTIWLQSEQKYFTDYQLNEINTKQYYTHNIIKDNVNNLTLTCGHDAVIMSKKIYFNLYKLISEQLLTNNIDDLKSTISYACLNTNSYIIYPNILVNIDNLKPLYNSLYKLKSSKEKKIQQPNFKYTNVKLRALLMQSHISNTNITENINGTFNLEEFKNMCSQEYIDSITDPYQSELFNNYIQPYISKNYIYNPNHFNMYINFNKELIEHFDWEFYKLFYEDLVKNDTITSYEDAMTHYINFGYKELRYICLDEYLYDKLDSELEYNIKLLNTNDYYNKNKEEIDAKGLTIKPIIYYINHEYENKSIQL